MRTSDRLILYSEEHPIQMVKIESEIIDIGRDDDQNIILANDITDFNKQFHQLGFSDTLTHVGYLDGMLFHHRAPTVESRAAPTRAGPGK